MGVDLINYPDDVGTLTANLLPIKIFLNSVISTKEAKFANADLANLYLMTPLKWPKYTKIKLTDIPKEVIREYKLHEYVTPDRWVYIKVIWGLYGVRLTSSRITWPRFTQRRLEQRGIFSKPNSAWILEAHNQTNPVCPGGRTPQGGMAGRVLGAALGVPLLLLHRADGSVGH
jgi:hypothetical protein